MTINHDTPLPPEFFARLPVLRPIKAYGSMAQSMVVVESLRLARVANTRLHTQTQSLRRWQTQRFRSSYADILQDPHMGPAANFFLEELYGDKEFGQRDAQFVRISSTLERVFPKNVIHTATLLAQLHALSESLDAWLTQAWLQLHPDTPLDFFLYQTLWQLLLDLPGYSAARQAQLLTTQELGQQLHRHTRLPGLGLMLRMMRGPASAAGLLDLQRFLECGFETFGQLGRAHKVPLFLNTIVQRETAWLERLAG